MDSDTKKVVRHIFAREGLIYGSETGNWYGKCKDCGIDLTVHTGAASLRPAGASIEERIYSNGPGPEGGMVLSCNFEEFVKGCPNMLVRYADCLQEYRPYLAAKIAIMGNLNDMRLRIINSAPCRIKYLEKKPACFPFGVLFITGDDNGISATFGDLTVPVTVPEAFMLMGMAEGPVVGQDYIETRHLIFRF